MLNLHAKQWLGQYILCACNSSQVYGPVSDVSGRIPPSQVAKGRTLAAKVEHANIEQAPHPHYCLPGPHAFTFITTLVTVIFMRCMCDHSSHSFMFLFSALHPIFRNTGNFIFLVTYELIIYIYIYLLIYIYIYIYIPMFPLIPIFGQAIHFRHFAVLETPQLSQGLERLAPKPSGCLPLRRNGSGEWTPVLSNVLKWI